MDELFQPDSNFPFDDIKLKTPRALQGGTYSANLDINDNSIIIQTPKCKTKKGVTKTAKQLYSDLLFNQDHNDFIDWLETLQERIRELIYENSENWFHESPTLDDIEYNWNNSIRTYKQTNYLVRTFVHKSKGSKSPSIQIYDSEQKQLTIDDVDKDKNVICILEIVGIKFSSQSFQLDICLRQIMVLNEKPLFNKCLIRLEKSSDKNNVENLGENNEKAKVTDNLVHTSELSKNLDNRDTKVKLSVEEEEEEEIEKTTSRATEEPVDKTTSRATEEPVDKTTSRATKEQADTTTCEEIDELTDVVENEDDTTKTTEENIKLNVEKNEKDNITVKTEIKNELDKEKEKQNQKDLEKIDGLEEIELNVDNIDEIKLKNPNEVYLDIYREARKKAKLAKKEAIKAYLEAKKIKQLYLLDEIDSSSSESDEDLYDEDENI